MAIVFIVLAMIVNIVSAILDYLEIVLIQSGEVYDHEKATLNDERKTVVLLVLLVVTVLCAIFFIQWFRRAYFNLHQLNLNLKYTEGWASGAWFVPILSLVRPYQIMAEMWKETVGLLKTRGLGEDEYFNGAKLLGIWWGAWIISNVASQVSYRILDDTNLESFIYSDVASIIDTAFNTVAGVLLIIIIKKYAALEVLLPQALDNPFQDFGVEKQEENWESESW